MAAENREVGRTQASLDHQLHRTKYIVPYRAFIKYNLCANMLVLTHIKRVGLRQHVWFSMLLCMESVFVKEPGRKKQHNKHALDIRDFPQSWSGVLNTSSNVGGYATFLDRSAMTINDPGLP